ILYPTRHLRVNGFQSVIFRRTYKRIKMAGGIWDDTHKFYPPLGGKATENDLTWTFKGDGYESTVQFAHMQYTSNMYDYKGVQAAQRCHIGAVHRCKHLRQQNLDGSGPELREEPEVAAAG